jgi:cell wall-associated NlpC family hydrolase
VIQASEFAAAAESFAGVRWRLHGRSRAAGVDCGGLLVAALAEVGIQVADTRDYDARMPSPDLLWRLCRDGGVETTPADCGEGRVGLCRWRSRDDARHLVVMLSGRRIVHVDASVRRVTVVPAEWLDGKLVAVFRAKGVDYGGSW